MLILRPKLTSRAVPDVRFAHFWRSLRFALALAFLAGAVVACAGTGTPGTDSSGQRAAFLELTVQTAAKAIAAEVDARRLKGARAEEMRKRLAAARQALAAARVAVDARSADALTLLTVANGAVAALLTYLNEKGT